MLLILEEQEILAQFLLLDLIWRFPIVIGQLAHCQQICFLGSFGKPAQLHILDHLLP